MNPEPVLMRFRACRCMRDLMRFMVCRYMRGLMRFRPCRCMRDILVDNIINYYAMCYCSFFIIIIVEYYMSCYERCVCCTGVIEPPNHPGGIALI